ncbi:MAG: aspartate aminotransferase family protein [Deltaproteobacteria bacterium]|nr:aspartate aminotransferase family protein [Deltaproteobacteria bacterium]
MKIPEQGTPRAALMARMDELARSDADWRRGKTWSLVYWASDEALAVVKEAYTKFFSENGLNPMAFPSLRRFEQEVMAMAVDLFHGPPGAAGSMTSGGSESILMAVKAARDWARVNRPGVKQPKMLVPLSVHPAFEKAAHYFGVSAVHMPLGEDLRVDVARARDLVTADTILVVGSAPAYPHGVIDPIEELAALARQHGILCHVDACVGGYFLPFLERTGRAVPPWDFRVDGVTSISADLHKYGFAAKGASTVVYRSRELRRFQYFTYGDWPGGLYGSPSMTGTRPGGAIAAAWAALNHIGMDGYTTIARDVMDTTGRILDGIRATPGLRIMGNPVMGVFAFTSDVIDVYGLADVMEKRGWKLDRQQRPPCLHMMVTPAHKGVVDAFLTDLRECVNGLEHGKVVPEGSSAMYGMLGSMEDRGAIHDIILDFMDGMDTLDAG